jgi:hypothetical protein
MASRRGYTSPGLIQVRHNASSFTIGVVTPYFNADDRKGADSSFIWDPVAAECTYIPHSAARRPSAVLLGPTNAAPPGSQTFHFNGVFGFDAKQDEVGL